MNQLALRDSRRLGVAEMFVNRDGSLNVKLDAVPLSGQLQIRDQSPPVQGDGDEQAPPLVSAPSPQRLGALCAGRGHDVACDAGRAWKELEGAGLAEPPPTPRGPTVARRIDWTADEAATAYRLLD